MPEGTGGGDKFCACTAPTHIIAQGNQRSTPTFRMENKVSFMTSTIWALAGLFSVATGLLDEDLPVAVQILDAIY